MQYTDILLQELSRNNIFYKETAKDIIIYCPYCLREGKEKLKLYISKSIPIFHCFRCNKKGSLIYSDLLYQLNLTETLTYLYENIDLCEVIQSEDIIEQIQELDRDHLLELYRNNSLSFHTDTDSYMYHTALSYLQKRNIDIYWLNRQKIKYYIDSSINSRTYGRIIFPTFFNTNYEARTYIGSSLRYLKHISTVPYPDMVLFINIDHTTYNSYVDIIPNHFNTLIFTEGIFDALILAQYGFNSCSIGGKVNTIRSIIFIQILKLVCDISFDRCIYIFDNDVRQEEIQSFINYVHFNFSDTITIEAYKMPQEFKDLNSISDENILFSYLENINSIYKGGRML